MSVGVQFHLQHVEENINHFPPCSGTINVLAEFVTLLFCFVFYFTYPTPDWITLQVIPALLGGGQVDIRRAEASLLLILLIFHEFLQCLQHVQQKYRCDQSTAATIHRSIN